MNPAFHQVIDSINQHNLKDPNKEPDEQGEPQAKEWLYSQRMSHVLNIFEPHASELLKIAAHGQHIERWRIPRSDYPMDRSGYKKWRLTLGQFHGERTAEIMSQAEYSTEDCQRVQDLILKKRLKRDIESQTLEDVVCLVFLQFYFSEFAAKHSEEKLITIVQKTWNKMSEKGHQAALKLPFSDDEMALLTKALAYTQSD